VVASLLLLFFWQRVYKPDVPSARGAVGLVIALLVGALCILVVSETPQANVVNPWYEVAVAARALPYAPNGWSSVGYWAMLRRRLSFGLVDRVVVNRLLLWSVATWAITLQSGYSLGVSLLRG
jgi:hypothetical protein